ncbi:MULTISPECIES: FkbM family methyltransferase [Streptomyces]|uniref:FkbM family methyltransferase n=1 Tax=Streptomyces cadmiisoli TaxID=2184053 RepID=A0A2Z4IUF8_9ACTN|nr:MULTISPECIES: FkbM family methyltransferase [Streptomyces]AWW36329.1 FkbM family methyltransferase [Streptomyces cadmiisoli]KOV58985.1 FkbM family methyltransferase [Streptomyces sp. AS58]
MQTLYRRLLRLMPRLGLQVTDLGPGTAVVSRRGRRIRTPLGPGADLLVRNDGRYSVSDAGKDAWLVLRGRAPAAGSPAPEWTGVPLGDTGARLLIDRRADADERKIQLAAAEYLCSQHVTAMLELYGVNCVFDVGANTGQYARRLRRLGYTGRIVSFEPTSNAFARLRDAAAGDPDWQVHHCGLGREDTATSIHVGWKTMNSLLPPSDYGRDRYPRFATTRTEQIEIRRLDSVMDEALDGIKDPRPYLKMDTQGYDLEVFAGAGVRVADFVGLQSEVAVLRLYEGSPPMSEAVAAYEAEGFDITGMYPVTREAATGRVVEFDCVMMRAKSAPAKD